MNDKKLISPTRGVIALVIGVFFVSWASILIRLSESNATTIAFFRMFFSTLMMAAAVPFFKGTWFSSKKELSITILSGFFLGLHFYTWIASLDYTSISSSVILVSTQPIFVAIFGILILKEGIGKLGFWAIILSLIGSFLVARGDFTLDAAHFRGDLLAIAGAITAALYLFIGRTVRPKLDLIPYVLLVYTTASITILLLGIFFNEISFPTQSNEYLIFILLALGPTILGHNMYNFALRHLPAFPVGISILGEPVLATIWGVIIFSEIPLLTTILGGIIIILAVAMVMFRLRSVRGNK